MPSFFNKIRIEVQRNGKQQDILDADVEGKRVTGNTHGAIGLAAGIGVVHVTGAETWLDVIIPIAVSFVASLLPDMDAEESKIQSLFLPGLSRSIRKVIFIGIAILTVLAYILVSSAPFWLVLIGLFFGIAALVSHRTVTHSLLMVIYLGWTVNLIWPEWMWAFVVGYLSHLIADALTVSGIPFFWPWSQKISLSLIGIRIRTGSAVDQAIGVISFGLFILGIFYLFI